MPTPEREQSPSQRLASFGYPGYSDEFAVAVFHHMSTKDAHVRRAVDAVQVATSRSERIRALQVNTRYKVRHKSDIQVNPRESILVYLGENRALHTLSFDALPISGTQQLPREWFISAEIVPLSVKPYMNRVIREV